MTAGGGSHPEGPATDVPESHWSDAAGLAHSYTAALIAAQASHDPWDWLCAGSIFKRYAIALAAARAPTVPVDPPQEGER